ncbi:MAG TPA: endonuclease domain-containing protein [Chitinivibrionales bacterium]|nr:endonuclease domain-containing protein [Chitinivibrionales bacterium]
MALKTENIKLKYSGVVQLQRISKGKVTLARIYRQNMTPAEAMLWSRLRGKKCGCLKFRRQQIIEGFIADFFCAEKNLVIEVDGSIHDDEEQKKVDKHRNEVFSTRGIRELRFKNSEIEHDIDDVIDRINNAVNDI